MNLPQVSLLKVGAFLFMAGIAIWLVNVSIDMIEGEPWMKVFASAIALLGLLVGFATMANMNELD